VDEWGDIKLFFSVAEKKSFLQRRGYSIERESIVTEMNIYQNVFEDVLSARDVAVDKDGVRHELHSIFEKELKQAILKL